MKTAILKVIMLVFLIVTISACSNDDDNSEPKYIEENFFAGYLEATGFNQDVTPFSGLSNYEQGLEFKPLVTGKITAIKVKLPEVNASLKITIWNKATTSVLRTEIVNIATENTEVTFDIDDLDLVKDNEYAITMNTKDVYIRRRSDESDAIYPVVVGNIHIDAYIDIESADQTYPTNSFSHIYYGDLSFDFLQTE